MKKVTGNIVSIGSEHYYKISDFDLLAPFYINVVSGGDLVLFASSRGGLTAARKNSSTSIFPYETDDKLHQQAHTGPKTLIWVDEQLWEPLSKTNPPAKDCSRNIYKNMSGNSLLYEEINHVLGLAFRYEWLTSDHYGFVRRVELENLDAQPKNLRILDGLENILPWGVDPRMQERLSCLVDAYKSAEMADQSSLAVYSLTTKINDTPNPIEILRANVAWSTRAKNQTSLLSSQQINPFYYGLAPTPENIATGVKTAYLTYEEYGLAAGEQLSWALVLDVAYDHADIARLENLLAAQDYNFLWEELKQSQAKLGKIIGACDGLQCVGNQSVQYHHALNTLYNTMRGGFFPHGYQFEFDAFVKHLQYRNKVISQQPGVLAPLKACSTIFEAKAAAKNNSTLYRLVLEYLPLAFSRRHGDPSRPWNQFDIHTQDEAGGWIYNYEGNWRDIFQNWEALGLSYPPYLENFVTKFLNASTADGYNPYRINHEGIDWERLEPDNPFSGFGYWGDHQIIYLAKLLKQLEAHYPGWLREHIALDIYCYANLPYELLPYDKLLADSKNTIFYNHQKEKALLQEAAELGSDGKLIHQNGEIYQVSLLEKLLVPILAKLSNLLPEGGIWMNTQRPEWNDANNGIVGIGLSLVTTMQLYEYLQFLQRHLQQSPEEIQVSLEVVEWTNRIIDIYSHKPYESQQEKRTFFNCLGQAYSDYREKLYQQGLSVKVSTSVDLLLTLINRVMPVIALTLDRNQQDGLYHSYSLLGEELSVHPMAKMLEGQSAVISSGFVTPKGTVTLLEELYQSPLYALDQQSFYLYPLRKAPSFLERNRLGEHLSVEMKADNRILQKDINGMLHFSAEMTTKNQLEKALIDSSYNAQEQAQILAAYEALFQHNQFVGRAQVMYKYEGIGCIYWHQNAKLLLAVQDQLEKEYLTNGVGTTATELLALYRKIAAGFIYQKPAQQVGTFPLEPYSHTSFTGKAEQPGMTGQVKESIIARRRELGVIIQKGQISFHPFFLEDKEFNQEPLVFGYYNRDGLHQELCLPANSLAFTLCRVPVIYTKADLSAVEIMDDAGRVSRQSSLTLSAEQSRGVFEGKGISQIRVCLGQ